MGYFLVGAQITMKKHETLTISIEEKEKKIITLIFVGKFNIESVPLFDDKYYSLINTDIRTIYLNFKKLTYIDSSGIGALIRALNVAKKSNIEFILYDVQEAVHKILEQAYIDKYFTFIEPGSK